MAKWEYRQFADAFQYAEEWIEFLNKKGSEGWELISFTQQRYIMDKSKYYRCCIFKRKIED